MLALRLLHDLEKHVGADLFVDARLGEVVAENIGGVNRLLENTLTSVPSSRRT